MRRSQVGKRVSIALESVALGTELSTEGFFSNIFSKKKPKLDDVRFDAELKKVGKEIDKTYADANWLRKKDIVSTVELKDGVDALTFDGAFFSDGYYQLGVKLKSTFKTVVDPITVFMKQFSGALSEIKKSIEQGSEVEFKFRHELASRLKNDFLKRVEIFSGPQMGAYTVSVKNGKVILSEQKSAKVPQKLKLNFDDVLQLASRLSVGINNQLEMREKIKDFSTMVDRLENDLEGTREIAKYAELGDLDPHDALDVVVEAYHDNVLDPADFLDIAKTIADKHLAVLKVMGSVLESAVSD